MRWLFSGWNCVPKTFSRLDGRHERRRRGRTSPSTTSAPRPGGRRSCARSRRPARHRGPAGASTAGSTSTSFQPTCGTRSAVADLEAVDLARDPAEPVVLAVLGADSTPGAASRGRCRASAPPRTRGRRARSPTRPPQAAMPSPKAPTPGSTTCVAPGQLGRLRRDGDHAVQPGERVGDRPQVAHPVVDDAHRGASVHAHTVIFDLGPTSLEPGAHRLTPRGRLGRRRRRETDGVPEPLVRLRPAREGDRALVWQWANDPAVRAAVVLVRADRMG